MPGFTAASPPQSNSSPSASWRKSICSCVSEALQDVANLRKALSKTWGLRMLHTGDVIPGGGVQPCSALRNMECGKLNTHPIALGKN